MDIEERLKKLQSLFTFAQSGSITAKANYLTLLREPQPRAAEIVRAKLAWQQLEARKTAIIARMVELEELEQEAFG
ncbi:MAG TPA: hypothetical protein VGO37_18900 [Steroidobacteraceae bacterium]|jgi:hypothetical protein|nr:hypothetical protein [Steroidobacteraceae bacterium]